VACGEAAAAMGETAEMPHRAVPVSQADVHAMAGSTA